MYAAEVTALSGPLPQAHHHRIAAQREQERSPLGVCDAGQDVAVGDLVIVQEALVLLVNLASLDLACSQWIVRDVGMCADGKPAVMC
jgi:hypothetical protein